MTMRSAKAAAIGLGTLFMTAACASELPQGAPPIDPYGSPTLMNRPLERKPAPDCAAGEEAADGTACPQEQAAGPDTQG